MAEFKNIFNFFFHSFAALASFAAPYPQLWILWALNTAMHSLCLLRARGIYFYCKSWLQIFILFSNC